MFGFATKKDLEKAIGNIVESANEAIAEIDKKMQELKEVSYRKASETSKVLMDEYILPGIRKEMLDYYKKLETHIERERIKIIGTVEQERQRENELRKLKSDFYMMQDLIGQYIVKPDFPFQTRPESEPSGIKYPKGTPHHVPVKGKK